MEPTITLPTSGPASTNYGLGHPIPRTNVARGIWEAVNRYGSVRFVRVLKGARCAPACEGANPETWTTCSCACGGAHHGGGDHGILFVVDPAAHTSTVIVTPDNVQRVTGLKRWERRLEHGDRVRYIGEFSPADDGDSDLATVISVEDDHTVTILWDHSGETEGVSPRNVERIEHRSAA